MRVSKKALIKHQRYAHAKPYKRAKRELYQRYWLYIHAVWCTALITHLLDANPCVIVRGLWYKGNKAHQEAFLRPLWLAERVMTQKPRDDIAKKVYSLHAPEVECIGKGKAHKPYEFGVKASVATTLKRSKGGQFAIHAKALPGRPYDGHTLASVIPAIEEITGAVLKRILADAGYKGHNAPFRSAWR